MTKRAPHDSSLHSDFVIPSSSVLRHSSLSEGVLSTAGQVDELISLLDRHNRLAIDTEADSLHCYREKLCLLQISLPEGDFLVDPLAGNDLSTLSDALSH